MRGFFLSIESGVKENPINQEQEQAIPPVQPEPPGQKYQGQDQKGYAEHPKHVVVKQGFVHYPNRLNQYSDAQNGK